MGQTNEPSMEEILSSIKRIIAEDNESAPPRRARGVPDYAAPAVADEPDVLELTQALHEPEVVFPEAVVEEVAVEEAPALAEGPVAPPIEAAKPETLVSSASAEATRAALASLSRMVVKPEDPVADNTLEGLVRDLLRPMMKEWLDANLPRIVEAAVNREVKRIAGQGGD